MSDEGAFFENDEVRALREKALEYARAGVPIHFSGPAGLGKTSLAFEVAKQLGRKTAVMTGNQWLSASDFVGAQIGATTSSVVDRYVHSVQKTEKQARIDWGTSVLTEAMVQGQTLVYDEFTRAPPEANATLLSVLEEGLLICTDPSGPQRYIRAHPDFRIILTSNPQDYAAVNSAPDALLDRIVTLPMQRYSVETIARIVQHGTGFSPSSSLSLVQYLTEIQNTQAEGRYSVLRTALLVARIATYRSRSGGMSDTGVVEITNDILKGRGVEMSAKSNKTHREKIAAE